MNFSIILIIRTLIGLLSLNKFLDLDLKKFQFFDLVKILTLLFSLFFMFLYSITLIQSFSIILNNLAKYSTNYIKIILSIKISSLAILLKF